MTIILGSSIQILVESNNEHQSQKLMQDINERVFYLLGIAAVAMITSFAHAICWTLSSENICRRLREEYLNSLLQHDIQYLEGVGAGQITTTISSDINTIQDTISLKAGLFISSVSTFFTAFIIAFVRNWKLTLIVSSVVPAMFVPPVLMSQLIAKNVRFSLAKSSLAHTVAADAISSMEVVQSLGIQDVIAGLYDELLRSSERYLSKKSLWLGGIHGSVFLVLFSAYALAFWQGSQLLASEGLNVGVIVNVLFAIMIGANALGRISRYLESIATARTASRLIFKSISPRTLENTSTIEINQQIEANISFQNVTFAYASRPEVQVLDSLSLSLIAGKTTAIVGSSGCGKSTILGLLERFYEPTYGEIFVGDEPIAAFGRANLRSQISLVTQQPTLFSMSIFENVCLGLAGTSARTNSVSAKRRMVSEACELAGIAAFINTLPNRYETVVGTSGMLLSGGQRQRLAFARAIIRKPRILLLDEPTSALDKESEDILQASIKIVAKSCTVVIVAHKLDSIRDADSIVVMERGKVSEQGTHEELLKSKGAYNSLLEAYQNPEGCYEPSPQVDHGDQKTDGHLSKEMSQEVDPMPDHQTAPTNSLIRMPQNGLVHQLIESQRHNAPERHLLFLGIFASMGCGAVYPAQAYVFAKLMTISTNSRDPNFQKSADLYSLMFFVIAVIEGLAHFTSSWALGLCSDRMIGRVQSTTFWSILHKNIEWFHDIEHSGSKLVYFLSEQCGHLAGLNGSCIALLVEILTNLISGAIFSTVVAWQYALPVLCFLPLIVAAGYLRFRVIGKLQTLISKSHERSAEVACEAIAAIKTVVAFTREKQIAETHHNALRKASNLAFKSSIGSCALFALSQGLVNMVNAFAIWYGAKLVRQGSIDLYQDFAVLIALTFGAQDAGELTGRVPQLTLARSAIDELTKFKMQGENFGKHSSSPKYSLHLKTTSITFQDVSFSYRSRPHVQVLSNFTIEIHPGQHVAIVGPSGSGKSTILGLLSRFYTPSSGTITLGGIDIEKLDSKSLRSLVSLVPQNPVLFPGTIRFNITMGSTSTGGVASQSEVEHACSQANILEFIQSLPEGFDTVCNKDTMSVGQKQRIALARAFIAQPKILLLDEPTASLDAHSVNHVVEAMSSSSRSRTTITVAHNLPALLKVDVVYVLQRGRIVESGIPLELLNRGGLFTNMMSSNTV